MAARKTMVPQPISFQTDCSVIMIQNASGLVSTSIRSRPQDSSRPFTNPSPLANRRKVRLAIMTQDKKWGK
ncbi:hypothetical protein D3C76_1513170 [compost metagenome]